MKTFIVALLLVSAQTSAFVARSSATTRQQFRSLAPSTQIRSEQLNEEAEDDLQKDLNKLTEDPPMWSAWSEENFDEKALPVPLFTAQIVSLASIGATVWIYYMAFTAPPANLPTL
ncbi:MAG: hypothetical protein SGBAC_002381 [Bacillariaceae sp.]